MPVRSATARASARDRSPVVRYGVNRPSTFSRPSAAAASAATTALSTPPETPRTRRRCPVFRVSSRRNEISIFATSASSIRSGVRSPGTTPIAPRSGSLCGPITCSISGSAGRLAPGGWYSLRPAEPGLARLHLLNLRLRRETRPGRVVLAPPGRAGPRSASLAQSPDRSASLGDADAEPFRKDPEGEVRSLVPEQRIAHALERDELRVELGHEQLLVEFRGPGRDRPVGGDDLGATPERDPVLMADAVREDDVHGEVLRVEAIHEPARRGGAEITALCDAASGTRGGGEDHVRPERRVQVG